MVFRLVAAAAVLSCISGSAVAAPVAAAVVNSQGEIQNNGDFSLGWLFNTSSAINVTDLGFFDGNSTSGSTSSSHEIGIYSCADLNCTSGSLLVSAVLNAGSALDADQFAYVGVTSTLLAPGQYIITGTNNGEAYIHTSPSITFADGITHVSGRYSVSSSLIFPTSEGAAGDQPNYFGPNFKFEAAAVPEPSTIFVASSGLIACFLLRRRNRD